MNYKKLTTGAAAFSLLAATLASASAAALSTATMGLSGSSNSSGNFTTTVYEDTGSDTVAGANVVLDFSVPVSGVSYDYSAGAFPATTPSGDAHDAYGAKTGTQVVAVVHFTLNNPGTVTATVDSSGSFLKNVDAGGNITNFPLSVGSANFTYTAPATPTQPSAGGTSSNSGSRSAAPSANKGTTANGSSSTTSGAATTGATGTTQTSAAVKGASTTKTAPAKAKKSTPSFKLTSNETISTDLIVLVAVSGAIGYFIGAHKLPKLRKPAINLAILKRIRG